MSDKVNDRRFRINIVVDPDYFPEIHAELANMYKKKKRVDGGKILHLATLGLNFYKHGLIGNGNNQAHSPDVRTVEYGIENMTPQNSTTDSKLSNTPVASQIQIADDEVEDLEKVMDGLF